MNMNKLSWFSADVPPAYPGVYQKDYENLNGYPEVTEYQYWDGIRWYYGSIEPEKTYQRFLTPSNTNVPLPRPWRGYSLLDNPIAPGELHPGFKGKSFKVVTNSPKGCAIETDIYGYWLRMRLTWDSPTVFESLSDAETIAQWLNEKAKFL